MKNPYRLYSWLAFALYAISLAFWLIAIPVEWWWRMDTGGAPNQFGGITHVGLWKGCSDGYSPWYLSGFGNRLPTGCTGIPYNLCPWMTLQGAFTACQILSIFACCLVLVAMLASWIAPYGTYLGSASATAVFFAFWSWACGLTTIIVYASMMNKAVISCRGNSLQTVCEWYRRTPMVVGNQAFYPLDGADCRLDWGWWLALWSVILTGIGIFANFIACCCGKPLPDVPPPQIKEIQEPAPAVVPLAAPPMVLSQCFDPHCGPTAAIYCEQPHIGHHGIAPPLM